jgi:acetyl esterase
MAKLLTLTRLLVLKMPAWVSALWYLGRRVKKDGLTLNAKVQLLCKFADSIRTSPIDGLTPELSRQQINKFSKLFGAGEVPLNNITDRNIPGPKNSIPVRIYSPFKQSAEPLPALLYFHGGGWVQGSIETHDTICRLLALYSGGLVFSVDYALAPENKFPAAVNDCLTAFTWVKVHAKELNADPRLIAVGGDSSGGNLAAVLCQQTPKDTCPMFQLLFYPALDGRLSSHSHTVFKSGFFLTREKIDWFLEQYTEDFKAQREDPRLSPSEQTDLYGQPPALIITAGFDPLRDEAYDYHTRLLDSGVKSEYLQYDTMVHAFLNMAGVINQGNDALVHAGKSLRMAWNNKRLNLP